MPRKEFMIADTITIEIALGMDVGISSKAVLEKNTVIPSSAVRKNIPNIPSKGVHLKKLPDMNDAKKPNKAFPQEVRAEDVSGKAVF